MFLELVQQITFLETNKHNFACLLQFMLSSTDYKKQAEF